MGRSDGDKDRGGDRDGDLSAGAGVTSDSGNQCEGWLMASAYDEYGPTLIHRVEGGVVAELRGSLK